MEQLSEAHHRIFSALANVVEKKLLEMEVFFVQLEKSKKISVEYEDNLNELQKTKIHEIIDQSYKELKEFHQRYGLKKDKIDLRRHLGMSALFLREDLQDSTAEKMKGSGTLEMSVQKDLNKTVNRLIENMNEIQRTCQKLK